MSNEFPGGERGDGAEPMGDDGVGGYWAKKQLVEAHQALTAIGSPDRETRPYPRSPTGKPMEFSLGVPDRIRRLGTVAALRSALQDVVRNGDAYSAGTAARALGWSDEKREIERIAARS